MNFLKKTRSHRGAVCGAVYESRKMTMTPIYFFAGDHSISRLKHLPIRIYVKSIKKDLLQKGECLLTAVFQSRFLHKTKRSYDDGTCSGCRSSYALIYGGSRFSTIRFTWAQNQGLWIPIIPFCRLESSARKLNWFEPRKKIMQKRDVKAKDLGEGVHGDDH